jgi:hypothetical protein
MPTSSQATTHTAPRGAQHVRTDEIAPALTEALDATLPAASPVAPDYTESDRVTVLYGYGKVGPNARHWLDDVAFVGGVARNVPYPKAAAWKKLPIGRAVHILPQDADDTAFARASGIQPMAPAKLAAMIEASDLDAIFAALGPERAMRLAQELKTRLGK